jgi:hypothetical protein
LLFVNKEGDAFENGSKSTLAQEGHAFFAITENTSCLEFAGFLKTHEHRTLYLILNRPDQESAVLAYA